MNCGLSLQEGDLYSITSPLHSPNGRQIAFVRPVQGVCWTVYCEDAQQGPVEVKQVYHLKRGKYKDVAAEYERNG